MVIDVPVQFPEYLRCKKLYLSEPRSFAALFNNGICHLLLVRYIKPRSQLPYRPLPLFLLASLSASFKSKSVTATAAPSAAN